MHRIKSPPVHSLKFEYPILFILFIHVQFLACQGFVPSLNAPRLQLPKVILHGNLVVIRPHQFQSQPASAGRIAVNHRRACPSLFDVNGFPKRFIDSSPSVFNSKAFSNQGTTSFFRPMSYRAETSPPASQILTFQHPSRQPAASPLFRSRWEAGW